MRALWKRAGAGGWERGSALVSALAVGIVGAMLAVVVVSSVISAAKDSGTDRARTSEVHTAEGAVDAAYAALEAGTPCRLPATGEFASGTVPKKTEVHATIKYYNAGGTELPCASDAVTGTAVSAVITALSTTPGESAKRTIESKVNLTPLNANGHGAAIFSATGVSPTNNFALRSLDPDDEADLWVDSGNYSCSQGATVDGNIIIINGSVTLDNTCRVPGDVYASGNFTVNENLKIAGTRVGGDVIARGNATIANGNTIGGNVLIHGSYTTWGTPAPVVGGVFRTGVPLAELPTYTAIGLPEVFYKPSDFAGFANTGDRNAAYRSWIADNAIANGVPSASMRNPASAQCSVEGGTGGNGIGTALVGPTVSTVFDARACATLKWGPNVVLKMRADLALYVANFTGTVNLTVESADGQPHRFWIISPDPDGVKNGTAVCGTSSGQRSGNIDLSADSTFRQPIQTFFYTPCSATISNDVEMYGQIYGKSVLLQNGLHVAYVPIGIPGVDLTNSTPVSVNAARVDIVYKREIHSS